MNYKIHNAVVIGSGVMGAAIAAHFANAGVPVTLLDIVPGGQVSDLPHARNKIVSAGFENAKKAKPAAFFSSDQHTLVRIGNLEDDFQAAVSQSDLVLEVIVENLKIKQSLMERIDAARKPGSIIASNTSGIPLKDIAAGRSDDFKKHFLGMHFFNPPRYLKLLEIIATAETLPDVVKFLSHFGEYRLGKGVVLCKDTPNFIGNRIAFGTGAFALDYILKNGYTVDEVDAITGPLMGRPRTATFRLIDLVGIDVWDHVGRNLAPAIPHDTYAQPYLTAEKPNALIKTMLERGWLGNKSKVGFYKEVRGEDGKKEFWSLNLNTLEHEAPAKPKFDSLKQAKAAEGLAERLEVFFAAEDKAARLVQMLTLQAFQYAAAILPEVADSPKPVDDAVRWGFGHEAGHFEIWDMLGVEKTLLRMQSAGFPAPAWVQKMLTGGHPTFYQYEGKTKVGVYDLAQKKYLPFARPAGFVTLSGAKTVAENAGATLRDIGDGVGLVEFHTKMNALDEDIFEITSLALDMAETEFDALVIGSEAENFSAGANLFMVVMASQQGMWDSLDASIRRLQAMNQRMRYFPKPVIVAPAGLALGGGAEVTMHASRVVAAGELYIGLVELGAGVIPAGGGTKEMLRRIVNPPMRVQNADALPYLQKVFEQIGMAKVATSAEEARQAGFLTGADRVILNRDHLLTEAKREALHLAASGYRPPAPELIYAAGRDALAALRVGIFTMTEGKYITEYEQVIAGKLAYVMTGGELSKPQWVTEQYILDLEREAFLSLCGEQKTQARMWNLLQTGKPLRN